MKINQIISLAELINKCNNDKDLKNPLTIINSIKLTKSLHSHIKEYFEDQKQLFNIFGVEQLTKDGVNYYDWNNKNDSEKELINNALAELNNQEYHIDYLNNMDEEDFVIYTRGLSNSEIVFLYDYLVKENKNGN